MLPFTLFRLSLDHHFGSQITAIIQNWCAQYHHKVKRHKKLYTYLEVVVIFILKKVNIRSVSFPDSDELFRRRVIFKTTITSALNGEFVFIHVYRYNLNNIHFL